MFSTYTAPSGQFLGAPPGTIDAPITMDPTIVYNPAVREAHRGSFEYSRSLETASDQLIKLSRRYRQVREDDIYAYGQKLIEFNRHLGAASANCYLGPLRGAAKPCIMAEVMSNQAITFDFFDSRQCGTTNATHPKIKSALQQILIQRDPGESLYRINLTDTARGGHGINALVPIIKAVHDDQSQFRHQTWQLDLHLFNDSTPGQLANIRRVEGLATPSFEINLTPYTVPSLVVEDYEPALAFDLADENGIHRFKPWSMPGKFLYQVGGLTHVVDSADAYRTFEELYSHAITNQLVNSPDHTLEKVVWNEYQAKA